MNRCLKCGARYAGASCNECGAVHQLVVDGTYANGMSSVVYDNLSEEEIETIRQKAKSMGMEFGEFIRKATLEALAKHEAGRAQGEGGAD